MAPDALRMLVRLPRAPIRGRLLCSTGPAFVNGSERFRVPRNCRYLPVHRFLVASL